MQTIPHFTLTDEQADLARSAFSGIDDLLFHADSEQAKDLSWLANDGRSPVPADRAARIRETLHKAIGLLREQTAPEHWLRDGADPAGVEPASLAFVEGLAASRKVSLDRAERLADLLAHTAPPATAPELNDTAALADLYYSGLSATEVADRIGAGVWEVRRAIRLAGIRSRKEILADTVRLAQEVNAHGLDATAHRYGINADRLANALGLPEPE